MRGNKSSPTMGSAGQVPEEQVELRACNIVYQQPLIPWRDEWSPGSICRVHQEEKEMKMETSHAICPGGLPRRRVAHTLTLRSQNHRNIGAPRRQGWRTASNSATLAGTGVQDWTEMRLLHHSQNVAGGLRWGWSGSFGTVGVLTLPL